MGGRVLDVGRRELGVVGGVERCGFGDEFVVGVEDFIVGVVREEIRDGGEVVFVFVGDEFVVSVFQHFGRETSGDSVGAGAEVDVNRISSPVAEEFDDFLVNFGAE